MTPLLPTLAATGSGFLLGAAILVMLVGRRERKLRDRMREARIIRAAPVATAAAPAVVRAAARKDTRLHALLRRVLGYDTGLPAAQVVPPLAVAALAVLAALLGWWRGTAAFGALPGLLVGCASGVMLARSVFGWQRRRYCKALFLQIPDTLGLVLRAVRAGLPVAEAVRTVSQEMPEPTRGEFQRLSGEMAIGQQLDVAVWSLHERTGITEYAFLAVTFGLQAQTGGSLTEALDNLSQMVRKRVALADKARALASEARFSAAVLIALPFVCGLGLLFIRPGYLDVMFTTDRGHSLLMAGAGFLAMGALSIRFLIRRSTEA
jgi:tight adherence protein B